MFIKTKAAVVTALFLSYGAQADTILNVATAGDQNMVDYVKTWLGPKFEAAHPGVKVQVVGTGPGDAGSNKIIEKLTAQKESDAKTGNDSNLLIVFYVQIMPDDFVMQLHRF